MFLNGLPFESGGVHSQISLGLSSPRLPEPEIQAVAVDGWSCTSKGGQLTVKRYH